MTFYIAPIVEGQTEQTCVERLLHRIWNEVLAKSDRLQVLEPFRGHRDALANPNGQTLTETVKKAYLKLTAKTKNDAESQSLLLILLDAESDAPCLLAPGLLDAARRALPAGAPVACVLAKRMTENWIVAGCSTLGGVNGLPSSLSAPKNSEDCSGAAWLEAQLRSVNQRRKYTKTADAKRFVAAMDIAQCRTTAPSFDKLCRELEAHARATSQRTGRAEQEPSAKPPPPSDAGTAK